MGTATLVSAVDARPTRTWLGVDRLAIVCTDGSAAAACRDVLTLARDGAPVPVVALAPGDMRVEAAGTLSILVARVADQPTTLTLRPYRAVHADESAGIAPTTVSWPAEPQRDAALRAGLGRLIPWLAPTRRSVPFPGPRSN